MTYSKYEVLALVAEMKNLTKAAEVMGYTQSGISHIINNLEKEFGFSLLVRGRSGVVPTENCLRLLPVIQNMITSKNQMDEIISSINGVTSGTVRLGMNNSVSVEWMPKMIHQFLEKYPGVEFKVITGASSEIYQALNEGSIDIGFLSIDPPPGHIKVKICEDPLVLVMPDDHDLCRHYAISIDMIKGYSFIGLNNHRYVEQVFENIKNQPSIRFHVSSNTTVLAMVREKLGISIMPKLMFNSSAEKGIVCRELSPTITRDLNLAYHPNAKNSPALNRFLTNSMLWLCDYYENDVAFRLESIEF